MSLTFRLTASCPAEATSDDSRLVCVGLVESPAEMMILASVVVILLESDGRDSIGALIVLVVIAAAI